MLSIAWCFSAMIGNRRKALRQRVNVGQQKDGELHQLLHLLTCPCLFFMDFNVAFGTHCVCQVNQSRRNLLLLRELLDPRLKHARSVRILLPDSALQGFAHVVDGRWQHAAGLSLQAFEERCRDIIWNVVWYARCRLRRHSTLDLQPRDPKLLSSSVALRKRISVVLGKKRGTSTRTRSDNDNEGRWHLANGADSKGIAPLVLRIAPRLSHRERRLPRPASWLRTIPFEGRHNAPLARKAA